MESRILPSKLNPALNYSGKIVEKIIEYLYFKHMYQAVGPRKLPHFDIEPAQALEVLRASIELGI